jgi:TetR/AcrR family transcriptional regulator, transcriptional repressor for nem operon
MTDSATQRQGGAAAAGKRERLVASAIALVHEQGAQATTLAEVAAAAGVPAGNVYYYFKTKDELLQAAVAEHAQHQQAALLELEREATPAARLKAFVEMVAGEADLAARYGCPQGTLCSELDKRGDELSQNAANLMRIPIDWVERQFSAMGRSDAPELAVALIASYQGISLLTNTFGNPDLMTREASRLRRWIDTLADEQEPPGNPGDAPAPTLRGG